MLSQKIVVGMVRDRELSALDKLVSYGRFGRNRSQLLRAIIDVGVANRWYGDIAMEQDMPVTKTDCNISCRVDLETLTALSVVAGRREIPMSKFVRRMIMACYYCDDYQDEVRQVLYGE